MQVSCSVLDSFPLFCDFPYFMITLISGEPLPNHICTAAVSLQGHDLRLLCQCIDRWVFQSCWLYLLCAHVPARSLLTVWSHELRQAGISCSRASWEPWKLLGILKYCCEDERLSPWVAELHIEFSLLPQFLLSFTAPRPHPALPPGRNGGVERNSARAGFWPSARDGGEGRDGWAGVAGALGDLDSVEALLTFVFP